MIDTLCPYFDGAAMENLGGLSPLGGSAGPQEQLPDIRVRAGVPCGVGPGTAYGHYWLQEQAVEGSWTTASSAARVPRRLKRRHEVEIPVDVPALPPHWVEEVNFKLIIRASWRWCEEHINVKGARVALIQLRRTCRSAANLDKKSLGLSDSMVTVGAFEKGRSPSPPLKALCRRMAAYVIACQVQWQGRLRHVESALNVSDRDSRLWEEKTPKPTIMKEKQDIAPPPGFTRTSRTATMPPSSTAILPLAIPSPSSTATSPPRNIIIKLFDFLMEDRAVRVEGSPSPYDVFPEAPDGCVDAESDQPGDFLPLARSGSLEAPPGLVTPPGIRAAPPLRRAPDRARLPDSPKKVSAGRFPPAPLVRDFVSTLAYTIPVSKLQPARLLPVTRGPVCPAPLKSSQGSGGLQRHCARETSAPLHPWMSRQVPSST